MKEPIGFRMPEGAPEQKDVEYVEHEVTIMTDKFYDEEPLCPTCFSDAEMKPERFFINHDGKGDIFGDLFSCTTCTSLMLLVYEPMFTMTKPVLTKWKFPKQ